MNPIIRAILIGAVLLAVVSSLVLREDSAVGSASVTATTSEPILAATPPMGWNSWDTFGAGVREDQVKAAADYMAKNLAAFGWKYMVVDIDW